MEESKYKTNPPDPASLLTVRKRHKDLHDLLKSLNSKLTDVSSNVDQEFLCSYRVHMLSVQSEIKHLKEEVIKGEQALNSDGAVAKLETEVKWFKDECARLRMSYVAMESDCKQMTDRYTALAEQKVFLNEQLKAIMKRNRVLQAEIEFATKDKPGYTFGEHSHASQRYDNSLMVGSLRDEEEDEEMHIPVSSVPFSTIRPQQRHDSTKNTSGIPLSLSIPRSKAKLAGLPSKKTQMAQSTSALNSKSKLKSSNAGEMNRQASAPHTIGYGASALKHNNTLRNTGSPPRERHIPIGHHPLSASPDRNNIYNIQNSHVSHKQQLEQFLNSQSDAEFAMERAAMEIFQDIKERKHAAAKSGSVKRFPAIRPHKEQLVSSGFHDENALALSLDEIGIFAKTSIIKAAGGVSGLGLDQFAENDRFSTIVKFLLNYDQFREVVSGMQEMV